MKERQLFSRRQALKLFTQAGVGLVAGAAMPVVGQEPSYVATPTDYMPSIPEAEPLSKLYSRRGVDNDMRVLMFEPRQHVEVSRLNTQWVEQYQSQEGYTPKVIEGVFELYGAAAVCFTQLSLKAEEYRLTRDQSVAARRVHGIWKQLEEDDIGTTLATIGLQSPEFVPWFYASLRRAGYDGVLATKSITDYGEVYDVQVWDNRLKQWRGKSETQGFRFIVLDMATGETYYNRRDGLYNYLPIQSNTEDVTFGWLGDMSWDIFEDQLPLDVSGQALVVRGVAEPFSEHTIVWPTYTAKVAELSNEYTNLATSVSGIFTRPNFASGLYAAIEQMGERFTVPVANLERSNNWTQGLWMAHILHHFGLPLVWEPIDSNEFLRWTREENSPEKTGVPMGSWLQQQLFDTWQLRRLWQELRGTPHVPIRPNTLRSGVFMVVRMDDHYSDEQLIRLGFVSAEIGQPPTFVWFDEVTQQTVFHPIRRTSDYELLLQDSSGVVDSNRVIKVLG